MLVRFSCRQQELMRELCCYFVLKSIQANIVPRPVCGGAVLVRSERCSARISRGKKNFVVRVNRESINCADS